jgi:hypothetical protein
LPSLRIVCSFSFSLYARAESLTLMRLIQAMEIQTR